MKPRASIQLFRVSGVPVFAQVTLPIGLAVVSGFAFKPLAWLGLIVVVLVHELGHAVLLRRYRLPVLQVTLHGFGGECETVDWLSPWQRSVVAWGGVLAQAALFGVVALAAELALLPKVVVASDLFFALTGANVLIILLNLVPLRGLDGSDAWRIFRLAYLRGRRARLGQRLSRLQQDSAPGAADEAGDEDADDHVLH